MCNHFSTVGQQPQVLLVPTRAQPPTVTTDAQQAKYTLGRYDIFLSLVIKTQCIVDLDGENVHLLTCTLIS